MPGLDTNVLVRWIMDDDPRQAMRVQGLFEEVRERRSPLFVPRPVMLELEWVLRSRYKLDKRTVLATLNALLRNAVARISGRTRVGASPADAR